MKLLVLHLAVLMWVSVEATPSNEDCRKYRYCEGTRFPATATLKAKTVQCDAVSDPKDRCCLPQAKHFVCYNVMVDGHYLNYQPSNTQKSTNITALCQELLATKGATYRLSKHVVATVEDEGGFLIFRDAQWRSVYKGDKHIRSLACSYETSSSANP